MEGDGRIIEWAEVEGGGSMCSENVNINDGFDPWVGADYGNPNDLGLPSRLLILGESHYGDPEEYRRSLTTEVIEDQWSGHSYRYFTAVQKSVLGPSQEVDAKDFWKFVAFYNFIQRLVGEKPGVRPDQHMWKEAAAPFRETLNRLGPTHVIATGFDLWNNLPRDEDFWSDAPEDEVATIRKLIPDRFKEGRGWLGRYRHGSGKCLVVKIQHPSRGFSPEQWHPVIRDFMQIAP